MSAGKDPALVVRTDFGGGEQYVRHALRKLFLQVLGEFNYGYFGSGFVLDRLFTQENLRLCTRAQTDTEAGLVLLSSVQDWARQLNLRVVDPANDNWIGSAAFQTLLIHQERISKGLPGLRNFCFYLEAEQERRTRKDPPIDFLSEYLRETLLPAVDVPDFTLYVSDLDVDEIPLLCGYNPNLHNRNEAQKAVLARLKTLVTACFDDLDKLTGPKLPPIMDPVRSIEWCLFNRIGCENAREIASRLSIKENTVRDAMRKLEQRVGLATYDQRISNPKRKK